MEVPLLDLKGQYQKIKSEVTSVLADLFESQQFILGSHVGALEENIAAYCGADHAVGVSSGTDALLIALMTEGIGQGDLVITTPYTFFATAGAIARVGAIPVFADIDPVTFNLSPASVKDVITAMDDSRKNRLKAIVPVHLYGQCADMDGLLEIAKAHNLSVIEDAAQAIGSIYKGRRAGAMGDYGCFSFFPSKNLGAFGDGGIVTACDQERYDRLKIMRVHGGHPKYYHHVIGGNFRLDAIQAAVVNIKLKYLDEWTEGRQRNAGIYRHLFADAGLTEVVSLPEEVEERHIYNQFIIRVSAENRDELREHLSESSVGSEIYYPVPLHLQKCFEHLGYQRGEFPEAERAALETIALPIYPELTGDQLGYVVEKIKIFFTHL
jgi:dTDP-4-amino-4,6-dideoxygalactose transaminase